MSEVLGGSNSGRSNRVGGVRGGLAIGRDLLPEIGILFREEGGEDDEAGEERETGGTS
jgi:hypothetical protein